MDSSPDAKDHRPAGRSLRLDQVLGWVVLFLLLLGCVAVMRPFLSAVLWAVVLGFSLWPVQRRFSQWLGGRRTLAALLTTLSIAVVLVVPLVVIGAGVADDARALAGATRKWIEAGPPQPPTWLGKIPLVGKQAKVYWAEFAEDAVGLVRQLKPVVVDEVPFGATNGVVETPGSTPPSEAGAEAPPPEQPSRLVKALKNLLLSARMAVLRAGLAIGRGVVEVVLSVFLSFFIFRDGAAVADLLTTGVARIAGARGQHLLDVAGRTVRGVVYGILGTALVQGVTAAVGFFIAGVPGAVLLGLLTFFLSPVPVGPPLVWIPAVIWLYTQGSTGWAIFMLAWGLGVSSVDNIVKPWLISQGSQMPFIVIFFGVIGGALAFGVVGVFLGPTLLAVTYRLVEQWSTASPAIARPSPPPPAPDVPPAGAPSQ
jgi:predicted PurR-regulated permease PerM